MLIFNIFLQSLLVALNLYVGFNRVHEGENPAASFAVAGFIAMLAILFFLGREDF